MSHLPPATSHPLRGARSGPRRWGAVAGCIALLAVAGCSGSGSDRDREVERSSLDAEVDRFLQEAEPIVVEEGAAFEFDRFAVDEGWELTTAPHSGMALEGARATALDGSEGRFTNTVAMAFGIFKGSESLGEVTCLGNRIREGESTALDCFSTDDLPPDYDEIRVSDL